MANYITPEEATAELLRRGVKLDDMDTISPKEAQEELYRRGDVVPPKSPMGNLQLFWGNKLPSDTLTGASVMPQNINQSMTNVGGGLLHSIPFVPDTLASKVSGMKPDTSSLGYNMADIGGNVAQFMAGAALLDKLMLLPKVGSALTSLPGLLGKIAPSIAKTVGYGGIGAGLMPKHPLIGAATGAASVPINVMAGKAIEAISNLDAPQYAKMMLQKMFKGAGTDENRGIVGKMIKDQAENVTNIKNQNYSNVFDRLEQKGGGNATFPKTAQAWQTFKRRYPDAFPKIGSDLAEDTESALNASPSYQRYSPWDKNPVMSVRDANFLKGRLGESSYALTGFGNDSVEKNIGNELSKVKTTLHTEILNHAQKFGLDDALNEANNYYKAHYLPYVKAKNIFAAAKGPEGDENVIKNPALLFAKKHNLSQQEIEDKEFDGITTAIIAHHGGDELKNRILADSASGARNDFGNVKPDELLKSLSSLDKKGLLQYQTPDVKSMTNTLYEKLKPNIFGAFNPLQQAGKVFPKAKPWLEEHLSVPLSTMAKKVTPSSIQKVTKAGTGGVLGLLNNAYQ